MNNCKKILILGLLQTLVFVEALPQGRLTKYVNPLLGTATLWEPEDLGYVNQRKPGNRTSGAEVFPGASLPFAMVQVSPVTMFGSGAGYQYEDTLIYGFSHTNKGHWCLQHIPLLPVTGKKINADDYASTYSHDREQARPGYYQVFLKRYGINAELTSTLRCAYHKYTFPSNDDKRLVADMTRTNDPVSSWSIERVGESAFGGFQETSGGKLYFYAVSNYPVGDIVQMQGREHMVSVVDFANSRSSRPLELKIGFSFVDLQNAKTNLEAEMLAKGFEQVRQEADTVWEKELEKIEVDGGTERQRGLFYSCLYRSLMWPALRSDVNGDYCDVRGERCNGGYTYYEVPSFWDDYRNKLVLLEWLEPRLTEDVIKSCIDRGEKEGGYMPAYFHGDHASTFIAGSWRRGLHGFDLQRAYRLILKNATVPGKGGRPYLEEYMKNCWIAEKDTFPIRNNDQYKASVSKTLEYAYDDYAVAQVAKILGDKANYRLLMKRSKNYKHVFDPSTGFFRGRLTNGEFIKDFDPYFGYYAYMYREANAWQTLFYAPHDPAGILRLYPSKRAVEQKLDSLFSEPWNGTQISNLTAFIGNYCHGNQPDHGVPYMYYFVDRQPKAQMILDSLMNHFYDMGQEHLAYAGNDDCGEMSTWYVLNAIGLYTYSPADPEYMVTVPLFDRIRITWADARPLTIIHQGYGPKIQSITCGGHRVNGWFVQDEQLKKNGNLVIRSVKE